MNPVIPTVFTADPAARVWPGDERLWLYTSHDEPGTNTHDTMSGYHVFSTTDLVNWTDHGVAMHLRDVPWARSHMWAIDAVYWRGKYYLVYCAYEKHSGKFRTGLGVSDLPQGPFADTGYIRGVEHGQDPALFVDDDGTPYLFWGYGGECFACRLAEDLRSAVPGTTVDLTPQLKWVFEGPWVHKHQGRYYLSYPGLIDGQWPQQMCYATAAHPLGPYTFQGIYIPRYEGQAGTNHGSIVQYKGRWLAFHHSRWISGNGVVRSSMCDFLEYEPDGRIRPITPAKEGAFLGSGSAPCIVTLELDAAAAPLALGELRGTRVSRQVPGYTGHGYVEGFDAPWDGVVLCAQSGERRRYALFARYRAPHGDRRNKILVNKTLLDDFAKPTGEFDKYTRFPAASEWTELQVGEVELQPGDNFIKIYVGTATDSGGIELDRLVLRPLPPTPAHCSAIRPSPCPLPP